MNILETIIAQKKAEVAGHKAQFPIEHLLEPCFMERQCVSFKNAIRNSDSGIIAEFKRKSPSKGWIHPDAEIGSVIPAYTSGGAAAISVLTDLEFFGGNLNDLKQARMLTHLPLLRKDFIIDEYQILQAKAFGADCILLIVAALTKQEIKHFTTLAQSIGLEVLVEVHEKKELDSVIVTPDLIGINNRNLKTFRTSVDVSIDLFDAIPDHVVKISESGISSTDTIRQLRCTGYDGFLMGENFMKESSPGDALRQFCNQLI